MGLFDFLKKKNSSQQTRYIDLLRGYPVFSQFGSNIYLYDAVQTCIDRIASEISKLSPKHIFINSENLEIEPKSTINRLFEYGMNPYMTTADFFEKVIWTLYLNYNAFIYPAYTLSPNGSKIITGFYPLSPTQVEFVQDGGGNIFIKMYFSNGQDYILPYFDVIHLRKKFSLNDIMGGNDAGQADNVALLQTLDINHTMIQGVGKAVKASLGVRGILKIKQLSNKDVVESERQRFETAVNNAYSAIMAVDNMNEYTPLTVDPKLIDDKTLQFINTKILGWFGVSEAIYKSDYTDDQKQAFYENTIEPLLNKMAQAFQMIIFSARERQVGNTIRMFNNKLMYLTAKSKMELIKITGEQGLLTDNQKLAILGYPPIEGGNRRTISLNYINVELADAYQLAKSKSTDSNSDNKKENENNAGNH